MGKSTTIFAARIGAAPEVLTPIEMANKGRS
jgi:hypothetical protein